MKTPSLLPLSSAALLVLAVSAVTLSSNKSSMAIGSQSLAPHVVDLPTVKVTPSQADLAYDQASQSPRVVDLPAVKVTPDLSDLAYYQAARGAERVITLATISVHPAKEDLANYLSNTQHGVIANEASVVRRSANYLQEEIAAGARTLIRASR